MRDRILAFAVEPAFAKRMYMAPDDVREAATEAMAELARPLDSSLSACSYKLVFRHTCLCAPPPRCCALEAAYVLRPTC